jgi:hypothetical protein
MLSHHSNINMKTVISVSVIRGFTHNIKIMIKGSAKIEKKNLINTY